jgi:hypothetical protein
LSEDLFEEKRISTIDHDAGNSSKKLMQIPIDNFGHVRSQSNKKFA